MSAIPPILAYRTPPQTPPHRLPWHIAAVAWAHIALGGGMVILLRPYVDRAGSQTLGTWMTIWAITMIVAPVVAGGAVVLGQRRFLARLIAATCAVPLLLAEALLGVAGLFLIAFANFADDDKRGSRLITTGIGLVIVTVLLLGLTVSLIRYISQPSPRAGTTMLAT